MKNYKCQNIGPIQYHEAYKFFMPIYINLPILKILLKPNKAVKTNFPKPWSVSSVSVLVNLTQDSDWKNIFKI